MSVTVGWLDDGECQGAFAESVLGLVTVGVMNGLVKHWIRYESGPSLGYGRNEFTEQFLKTTNDEWVLMIDSDMIFKADLLEKLLAIADPDTRPVVGPVCYAMNGKVGVFPAVFSLVENRFKYMLNIPENELFQVDAAGAACWLIHRSVFRRIELACERKGVPGRWWDLLFLGPQPCGEDMSFSMRCRAADVPLYVHSGIEIGHLRVKLSLDRKTWEHQKQEVVEAVIVEEEARAHSAA